MCLLKILCIHKSKKMWFWLVREIICVENSQGRVVYLCQIRNVKLIAWCQDINCHVTLFLSYSYTITSWFVWFFLTVVIWNDNPELCMKSFRFKWASARENLPSDRHPVKTQTSLSIRTVWSIYQETLYPWLSKLCLVKILIRLHEYAGWSESLLDAHVQR